VYPSPATCKRVKGKGWGGVAGVPPFYSTTETESEAEAILRHCDWRILLISFITNLIILNTNYLFSIKDYN
jgi:hypothetical protein